MKMKKVCMAALIVSLLLAGCGQTASSGQDIPAVESSAENQNDSDAQTEPLRLTGATEETAEEAKTTEETTVAADTVTEITGYPAFDFEKKTVALNSGYEMPILGLGMFSLSDSVARPVYHRTCIELCCISFHGSGGSGFHGC